jgi:ferredoxin
VPLHVERFAPKELEADLIDSAFDVALARSALTFHVPADRSILDVDSSCEEGTCGTCETRVLAGLLITGTRCSPTPRRKPATA